MKKLMNYAAIAATMILILGTSTVKAQLCTDEQKAVWQEVENMWANWKAGDMDAAFANVSKDYLGWSQTAPMPTSYTKWVVATKDTKDFYSKRDYDIEPARVLVHGNTAIVHSFYNFSYVYSDGEKSEQGSESGRWTMVYVKENGNWMMIGDFTFNNPKE